MSSYGITYDVTAPDNDYIYVRVAVPGNIGTNMKEQYGANEDTLNKFDDIIDNIKKVMSDCYYACDDSYRVRCDIVSDVVVEISAEEGSDNPADYIVSRLDNNKQTIGNAWNLYSYENRDYFRDIDEFKTVIENQKPMPW